MEKKLIILVVGMLTVIVTVGILVLSNSFCFHTFRAGPFSLVTRNQADASGTGVIIIPVESCPKCGLIRIEESLRSAPDFRLDIPVNVAPSIPKNPPNKK